MKPHECPNDHKIEWCSEHIAYCRECCDENRMAWYFTDGILVPYTNRSIYELVLNIVLLRQKLEEAGEVAVSGKQASAVDVYSREECTFNYCDNPGPCKQINACRYVGH